MYIPLRIPLLVLCFSVVFALPVEPVAPDIAPNGKQVTESNERNVIFVQSTDNSNSGVGRDSQHSNETANATDDTVSVLEDNNGHNILESTTDKLDSALLKTKKSIVEPEAHEPIVDVSQTEESTSDSFEVIVDDLMKDIVADDYQKQLDDTKTDSGDDNKETSILRLEPSLLVALDISDPYKDNVQLRTYVDGSTTYTVLSTFGGKSFYLINDGSTVIYNLRTEFFYLVKVLSTPEFCMVHCLGRSVSGGPISRSFIKRGEKYSAMDGQDFVRALSQFLPNITLQLDNDYVNGVSITVVSHKKNSKVVTMIPEFDVFVHDVSYKDTFLLKYVEVIGDVCIKAVLTVVDNTLDVNLIMERPNGKTYERRFITEDKRFTPLAPQMILV